MPDGNARAEKLLALASLTALSNVACVTFDRDVTPFLSSLTVSPVVTRGGRQWGLRLW
jgi:hypothetical protein